MGSLRYSATTRWLVLLAALALALPTLADEGMWTFDNLPLQQLKEKYGFTPTQAWLDHLRLSCVRLNAGGSGAFVSPNGLLLTNQHIARDQLQKASTAQMDYKTNGFYAPNQAAELKAPGMEASVLVSMEDVTAQVAAAAPAGLGVTQQAAARQSALNNLTRDSQAKTGLHSEIVTLYQGGEYWLYRYKIYTDLRLVFAPEQQAANFGGDTDNFTFPRFKLDMALFRVYEDGHPIASPNFLVWNRQGAAENELVFVAGHPGATQRLDTLAQLNFTRDVYAPLYLKVLHARIDVLRAFASGGAEQARVVDARLLSLENALKSREGELQGLQDTQVMAGKATQEADFKARVAANPAWQAEWGSAWDAIAAAEATAATRTSPVFFRGLDSDLAASAYAIVDYAAEVQKPDAQRSDGYHDAQLAALRQRLTVPTPVDRALETARLAGALDLDLRSAGPGDSFVESALNGQTPAAAAAAWVGGTHLDDPNARRALIEGGPAAVAASTDPMIALARRVQPLRQEFAGWSQLHVQSLLDHAGEQLGHARFAAYGKTLYPDATFSLRLSYGQVEGYPSGGTLVPYKTNYYGLYGRAAAFDFKSPFNLPPRYTPPPAGLDLDTPLDFVTTNDIIGGNSGSPVVNRQGELVGLVFDSNRESIVGNFIYDGAANRTIAVHTAAMTAALDIIYHAQGLLHELQGDVVK